MSRYLDRFPPSHERGLNSRPPGFERFYRDIMREIIVAEIPEPVHFLQIIIEIVASNLNEVMNQRPALTNLKRPDRHICAASQIPCAVHGRMKNKREIIVKSALKFGLLHFLAVVRALDRSIRITLQFSSVG